MRANGRASNPVLQSVFLAVFDHSVIRHCLYVVALVVSLQGMHVHMLAGETTRTFVSGSDYFYNNFTQLVQNGGELELSVSGIKCILWYKMYSEETALVRRNGVRVIFGVPCAVI